MNIYKQIKEANLENMDRNALSIKMDSGENRIITYSDMFSNVESISTQLTETGLKAGDRIAIISENCPEWIISYLAAVNIRCTAVLIDAMLPGEDISQLLKTSDVSLIITSPKQISKINQKTQTPILNIYDFSLLFSGFNHKISSSSKATVDADETIANIIFSSGTTRTAAGIMHTHEAMLKSTQMCLNEINIGLNGRFLGLLPCSHIYGVVTTLIGPLLIGAEIRFLESLTSDAILGTFAEFKPTIFPAVPKMLDLFFTQIMRKIESNRKTKLLFKMFFPVCYFLRKRFGVNLGKKLFKSVHDGFGGALDIICSAGAPLDKAVADFYYGCGLTLLITYGATETNIPTIGNQRDFLSTDTCGRAYPDVTLKISDSGEILIKSPYMMKGYFRDTDSTTNAFKNGWFLTGDLGQIDKKGRYIITGRVKDNIVLATGKKVIPDEVESHYNGIAGVKEFVVCGVPSSTVGCDEVHAFVVLDNGGIAESVTKSIIEIGGKLNVTMKIMDVHFVDSIPKTSLQKPKRFLLRKSVMENTAIIVEDNEKTEVINIFDGVIELVSKVSKIDKSMIDGSSKPFSQLGIDSLSAIDLSLQIEDVFNVRMDDVLTNNMTILDMVRIIETKQSENVQNDRVEKSNSFLYPMAKKLADYRIFRHLCGWARIIYKVKVKGEAVLPIDSGYIICANHLSNFDYLWLSINFKKERFSKFCCMAKKELFKKSPFSKRLTRVCGMIPVDRGNINVSLMQRCKTMLADKWGLLIHPEGTRSDDGNLGVLKEGAAQLAIDSNVPIIPAYINGAYEVYPKGKKLPKFFNFRKMRKYPIEVSYGEPIYPADMTAQQLTTLVEDAMKSLCTVKV